jgi:hypothetical protein
MKVRDISSLGIGLTCSQFFERGTILRLEGKDFPLARLGPLYASVIHANRRQGGEWHLGCVLERPLSEQELQPMIQEILKKRLNGQ